jgi:hypothetical protein
MVAALGVPVDRMVRQFVRLGRARDPSDEEIAAVESSLECQGIAGWLAVQWHSQHRESFPTFMQVHAIGVPRGTLDEAVAALRARTSA